MFKILEPINEKGYVTIVVTVDGDDWNKAKDKAFKELHNNLELKGFRKGKVPAEIAKQNISENRIWNEAVNVIIDQNVSKINDEILKNPIIARPQIEVTKLSNDLLEVSFKAPVTPDVKLPELDKYKDEINNLEPTKEEREAELKKIESLLIEIKEVDEKSKKGDILVIDFEGSVDGETFEGGTAKNHELELGSKSFIDGFEDQLIGHKSNEELEVKVTFPETYPVETLASKEAIFKTKINAVKRKIKLTEEEINKKVTSFGFDSLKQLEDSIISAFTEQKKINEYNKFMRKIISNIKEDIQIDIPKEILDHEVEHKFADFQKQLSNSGMNLKDYLKMINKDEKTFKDEDLRNNAEQTVIEQILFESIRSKLNFEVSKDELEEKYKEISETQKISIDEVKEQISEENLTNELSFIKLVEFFIK